MITKSVQVSALLALTLAGSASVLSGETIAFALIGDVPYEAAAGVQVFPSLSYNRMIADINSSYKKVKFTIHAGDIKAGGTLCADNVYTENLKLFNTYNDAAIYLPGD